MNNDNLNHIQTALEVKRSDLAYNITQKAGAELVLDILRQDVWDPNERDNIQTYLGATIATWYNEVWVDIATPLRPFDMKMDMCIKNCMEKLRTDWHYDPSISAPPPFVFDDLFRLLLGTVHIPLSTEITAMISAEDNVLTERNDVKEMLQHDQRWIAILKKIANICDGRDDESKNVCVSIETYSIPELSRQRETLRKAQSKVDVFSGLAFAFHYRDAPETQEKKTQSKTARIQIGDIQTLLCRMKQMF
jgi:hypothetical protein